MVAAYNSRPMSLVAQVHAAQEVMPPTQPVEVASALHCLSTGFQSPTIACRILDQVAAALHPTWTRAQMDVPRQARDEAAAAVAELQPQTGAEGILAAQAVVMNRLAMRAAQVACDAAGSDLETFRVCTQAAARLAGAAAKQISALHEVRQGKRQVIRVERVVVEAGGQAIVGSVETGGGAPCKPV
jgi:hypothetical protein